MLTHVVPSLFSPLCTRSIPSRFNAFQEQTPIAAQTSGERWEPGGLRGLQNRCRLVSRAEVRSIRALSANPLSDEANMGKNGTIKLTSLSSCAGCAAKLPQASLAALMKQLPPGPRDPKLLVNADTADDAGVYRISRDLALVQTVDFFTPIVDDPFDYGRIAATNAISDVYAMGGRPITAMNLLGIPADVLPPSVVAEIMRGGLAKATEARCVILGGHSIRLPEPVYGLAVTGLVAPKRVIANTDARPGDWLILTKPLGTGIVTTGIKRGLASTRLAQKATQLMCTLNCVGAELGERSLVRAGTDVTGFGLLGHLANICRGSNVCAEIDPDAVPAIDNEVLELIRCDCIPGGSRQNLKTAEELTDWNGASQEQKHLFTDAQTSGGLLLAVSPKHVPAVLKILTRFRTPCAAVIGKVARSSRPEIRILRARGTGRLQESRLAVARLRQSRGRALQKPNALVGPQRRGI